MRKKKSEFISKMLSASFYLTVLILLVMLSILFTQYDIYVIRKSTFLGDNKNNNITLDNMTFRTECYENDGKTLCVFPPSNYSLYYPTGKSMTPFLMGENEILLCNNNFTLEENGVYSFDYEAMSDKPVVHRCVKKTPEGCLFKGDYNDCFENVTLENIKCRIEFLIREIK